MMNIFSLGQLSIGRRSILRQLRKHIGTSEDAIEKRFFVRILLVLSLLCISCICNSDNTNARVSSKKEQWLRQLRSAAKHNRPTKLFDICDSLAQTGDPDVIKPLIRAFKVEAFFVPEAQPPAGPMHAVLSMGEIAVKPLCHSLRDLDWVTRATSLMVLGWIGDPTSIDKIGRLLNDPFTAVRLKACEALAHMGSPDTKPYIIKALQNSQRKVRCVASKAFIELADSSDIPLLVTTLQDSESQVRANSAIALGRLKYSRVIPDLLIALNDKNTEVQREALLSLGHLRSEEVLPHIRNCILDSSSSMRRSAIEALMTIRPPDTEEILQLALSNTVDEWTRLKIASAFVRLGRDEGVDELIRLLDASDRYVQSRAIDSLGMAGSSDGISLLIEIINDPNYQPKRYAFISLAQIGGSRADSFIMATALDTTSPYRYNAILSLGWSKNPIALETLKKILNCRNICTDSRLLENAICALSKHNDVSTLPDLLAIAEECETTLRYQAVICLLQTLGNTADSTAVDIIMDLKNRHTPTDELYVIAALRRIGPPHAIPALRSLLCSWNSDIRIEAAKVLRSLGYTLSPIARENVPHL